MSKSTTVTLLSLASLLGCADASVTTPPGDEAGRILGSQSVESTRPEAPTGLGDHDILTPDAPLEDAWADVDDVHPVLDGVHNASDAPLGTFEEVEGDSGLEDAAQSQRGVDDSAAVAPSPGNEDVLSLEDAGPSDDVGKVEEVGSGEGDGLLYDALEVPETVDAGLSFDVPDEEVIDDTLSPDGTSAEVEQTDTEPAIVAPLFLLSINNTTDTLERIDVATGAGSDLCQLETTSSYPSLTFSRDNVLYASRGGTALDIIDPCTCEITPVASYGGHSGVNGITSDQGLNLFGVASSQDEFITISTSAGLAQTVGPLGVDFGSAGATWAEAEQTVYAINSTTDALYEIAPTTGVATLIAPLSQPMGTVGIEMHPANGVLYACSSEAILLEIDTLSGAVSEIGHTGQEGSCTNLAAPWKKVPCLL